MRTSGENNKSDDTVNPYLKIAPFVFQITQWVILVGALKAAALRLEIPLLATASNILMLLIVYHFAQAVFEVTQRPFVTKASDLTLRSLLVLLVVLSAFCSATYFLVWWMVSGAVEVALKLADAL